MNKEKLEKQIQKLEKKIEPWKKKLDVLYDKRELFLFSFTPRSKMIKAMWEAGKTEDEIVNFMEREYYVEEFYVRGTINNLRRRI